MVNEFASVGGGHAFPHLPEKPLIMVHEALHSLPHKGTRIAATIGGKPGKPSLQVRIESHFHASRVRTAPPRVKIELRRSVIHWSRHKRVLRASSLMITLRHPPRSY